MRTSRGITAKYRYIAFEKMVSTSTETTGIGIQERVESNEYLKCEIMGDKIVFLWFFVAGLFVPSVGSIAEYKKCIEMKCQGSQSKQASIAVVQMRFKLASDTSSSTQNT